MSLNKTLNHIFNEQNINKITIFIYIYVFRVNFNKKNTYMQIRYSAPAIYNSAEYLPF